MCTRFLWDITQSLTNAVYPSARSWRSLALSRLRRAASSSLSPSPSRELRPGFIISYVAQHLLRQVRALNSALAVEKSAPPEAGVIGHSTREKSVRRGDWFSRGAVNQRSDFNAQTAASFYEVFFFSCTRNARRSNLYGILASPMKWMSQRAF